MSELADLARNERRRWAAPGSSHDSLIGWAKKLLPIGGSPIWRATNGAAGRHRAAATTA